MHTPRREHSAEISNLRRDRSVEINKWGYSILAGTITLAFTVAPGGLSGVQGFILGFSAAFLSILAIEMTVAIADR